ncbi:MAG: o-succinylbenzoate--CoA ligase [Calditrichaeota bacterium]|nr:MAG: o-succinylbenzoate--CoA ligase [Calditrichota bacterium]
MSDIPENLWRHLSSLGKTPAMISHTQLITWQQLLENAQQKTKVLQRSSTNQMEICALWGGTDIDTITTMLALWSSGATIAVMNTRAPFSVAIEQAKRISCRWGIDLTSTRKDREALFLIPDSLSTTHSFPTFSLNNHLPFESEKWATVIFTSGSSGVANACVHTFANHLYSAAGSSANIHLGHGDRWLLALPLYHVSGLAILFRAMFSGAAVTLQGQSETLAETIAANKITHLSLVNTQLLRLLKDPSMIQNLSSLKAILLGGSAIHPTLIERCHDLGLPIYTSYGSTEMASQITATSPNASLDELLTSGRVLPFRKMRIAVDGEIVVRGKTLFEGYLNECGPSQPLTPDGWFATGDMGAMDACGRLYIIGRKDNMFISGGENIYPEEIEKELLRLPGVEQAVVVPIADEEFGYRPIAFVQPAEGRKLDEIQIEAMRDYLPGYKIPQRLLPWPVTGVSSGIKINRSEWRDLASACQLSER